MSGKIRMAVAKRAHKRRGGSSLPADEKAEASNTSGSFKSGGMAGGKKGKSRLDRKGRASGGRASPFSSARSLSTPGGGGDGQGHQDDGPKGRELQE